METIILYVLPDTLNHILKQHYKKKDFQFIIMKYTASTHSGELFFYSLGSKTKVNSFRKNKVKASHRYVYLSKKDKIPILLDTDFVFADIGFSISKSDLYIDFKLSTDNSRCYVNKVE